ncbi:MAG: hypothetical protein ACO4AI_05650 [Prochlorothrix sp.]|nr:hypothetical protein [Prochlorothrix sp.]
MAYETKNPRSIFPTPVPSEIRRDIAYGMDALVPGVYVWCGRWGLRIGGCPAEEGYPGVIHSRAGVAVVLPGYRIWTTYRGDYDPR